MLRQYHTATDLRWWWAAAAEPIGGPDGVQPQACVRLIGHENAETRPRSADISRHLLLFLLCSVAPLARMRTRR